MYNRFLQKKQIATAREKDSSPKYSPRMATANSITQNADSNKSLARTAQWVQGAANTKTALILSEGCSSLFHPDHYQFRDYSPIGSVYVRK
jgi:hypothetical protein